MHIIIFSDLDGSLLDHADYSYADARPALQMIKTAGIPLVITTSKTRREVEAIRKEMGLTAPFIVENGGGVFFPQHDAGELPGSRRNEGYAVIELGIAYKEIRDFFHVLKKRFPVRGLGDMSLGEIADRTGLSLTGAAAAKEREFSEPFILTADQEIEDIAELAESHGMKITSGGRFYHLMDRRQDKGAAVRLVLETYRRHGEGNLLSIGIGDSDNDRPLLAEVSIPVLIPYPDGSYADISLPGLVRADAPGAKGWNDVMQRIINGLKENNS